MPTQPERGLTDTHCHLNHEQFADDSGAAADRARSSGIERLLVVGYDLVSSRSAVNLAAANDDIQAVIGIHPEAAAEWSRDTADELLALHSASPSKVAAWGEIGLDYHWEFVSREEQQRVLEAQLDCAASASLPVVIHCRDAYNDILDCLAAKAFSRAVLHCFTGSISQAERAVAMGLYLGVGGIATFKKSTELRDIYASDAIPITRLLLETDSPYLAPQPWRGKRNEPAYIVAVAEMLADLRHCPYAEIATQTSLNADALFGRMGNIDPVDR